MINLRRWDDDLDINILITDFIPFLGVLDAPTWDPTLLVDPVTGSPQVVDDKTKVSLEEMIKSEYTDFSQKTIGRAWWIKHQHEFTSDEMRLINHYQNKLRVYAGRITGESSMAITTQSSSFFD